MQTVEADKYGDDYSLHYSLQHLLVHTLEMIVFFWSSPSRSGCLIFQAHVYIACQRTPRGRSRDHPLVRYNITPPAVSTYKRAETLSVRQQIMSDSGSVHGEGVGGPPCLTWAIRSQSWVIQAANSTSAHLIGVAVATHQSLVFNAAFGCVFNTISKTILRPILCTELLSDYEAERTDFRVERPRTRHRSSRR